MFAETQFLFLPGLQGHKWAFTLDSKINPEFYFLKKPLISSQDFKKNTSLFRHEAEPKL